MRPSIPIHSNRAIRLTLLTALLVPALLVVFTATSAAASDAIPDGDLSADPEARGLAEMLFGRGRLAWEDADAETARELFERAAATWPADATYIYFAGLAELRLRRPAEAAGKIARALPPAESRIEPWRIRTDLGTALYLAGDPRGAEAPLRRALEDRPDDAGTLLTLGLVLLDLDRPAEAEGLFARARARAPTLTSDAHYYEGVAAWRQGDEKRAMGSFRESVGAATKSVRHSIPEVLADARGYLALAPAVASDDPPRWEVRLTAAWEYDDNPAILDDDLAGLALPVKGLGGDSRLAVAGRGAWHPFYDRKGFSLGIVLNAYTSRYRDIETLDQLTPQGIVQIAWGRDARGYVNGPLGYARVPAGDSPVLFVFQAGSSYTWLDGDSFGRHHVAAVGATVPWHATTASQLDLLWEEQSYFAGLEGRSYDGPSARLSQYVHMGRPERYVRVGYQTADQDADGTTVFDFDRFEFVRDPKIFDNERKGWFAELSLPLPKGLGLFLEVSKLRIEYDTTFPLGPFDRAFREDTRTDGAITLVAPVGERAHLTLRAARMERDSTLDGAGYVRRISSFGVTLHW